MAYSEELINTYVEEIKAGRLSLSDAGGQKLQKLIQERLEQDIKRTSQALRTETTTFSLEDAPEVQAQKKKVLERVERDVWQSVGRGGKPAPPSPFVSMSSSGLEEILNFLSQEQDLAQKLGQAFLREANFARKEMEDTALELLNARRKRRGWAARYNYPDRHGKRYLEDAIKGSAIVENSFGEDSKGISGSGFARVGWDEEKLLEMTRVDGRVGFWGAYEFGRSFDLPKGIWIGPQNPNSKGGTRKVIQRIHSGRGDIGLDRFYPTGGRTKKSVYAHDPAMHVFKDSIEAANSAIARRLSQEFGGGGGDMAMRLMVNHSETVDLMGAQAVNRE